MKKMFVYILECSDGSFYTGVTNNVDKRFMQHVDGINSECYTLKKRPLKLVYFEPFYDALSAINFEKKLKRWSHEKKKALINKDYNLLKYLSKKQFKK